MNAAYYDKPLILLYVHEKLAMHNKYTAYYDKPLILLYVYEKLASHNKYTAYYDKPLILLTAHVSSLKNTTIRCSVTQ